MDKKSNQIVEEWFNKHSISVFSVYILAFILIEQNCNKNTNKRKCLNRYVYHILKKLINDEKINKVESDYYKERISLDIEILIQLKDIVFDISNNPNLLQKDKWSSRNILLEQTNKCFPCKRKTNK